jgi:phosphohistidine phosphatase
VETAREPGKRLLLLRHAKSDWDSTVDDHERPLSGRGRRDGVAAGQFLAAAGVFADVVVCSTALRARQTWDQAAKGGARAREIRYLDDIYAASVPQLVHVVRALPETAQTVIVVGHAPGIPDLVHFLAVPRADSDAWARLKAKFGTCGLAILSVPGSWAEAGKARAELDSFQAPRGAKTPSG